MNKLKTNYLCSVNTAFDDVRAIIKQRNPQGHKGTFGHGLLIAGSCGMAGAAVLGGRAALRSGIGKLTIVSPECNRIILQTALPEAIVVSRVPESLENYDSVALGPGIGQSDEARELVRTVLRADLPRIIVDADGLNNLPDSWQHDIVHNTIITPHYGEWKRLMSRDAGGEMHDNDADLFHLARKVAETNGLYVVLKASRHINPENVEDKGRTIANASIFTPEAKEFHNITGNNGMATAGSGDVLTGILLGLLAQGYSHEDTCRLGVWLHGKAGDIAAARLGEHSLIASDIVAHLPDAFKAII